MIEEEIICLEEPYLECSEETNSEIVLTGTGISLFDPARIRDRDIVIGGVIKTSEQLDELMRENQLDVLSEVFGDTSSDSLPNESAIAFDSNILSSDGQHRRLQLVGINAHIVSGGLIIVQNRTADQERTSEFEYLFQRPTRRIIYHDLQNNVTGEIVVYQKPS